MSDTAFSFRWGIPVLDGGGFTDIPNLFLDYYTQAGIKRHEFLVIIHLARYQYNRPGSESRPSLDTVARQMGYTVRGLRKILEKMERRGLLKRHYRPGKTTIYDFSGFSHKLMDAARRNGAELGDNPEPQDRGTPEPQFPPPRNSSSAKEEKQKENINNNIGAADGFSEKSEIVALLTEFGITEGVARDLVWNHTLKLDQLQEWIHYAQNAQGLKNPQGFVVQVLKSGEPPPVTPASPSVQAPGGVFY